MKERRQRMYPLFCILLESRTLVKDCEVCIVLTQEDFERQILTTSNDDISVKICDEDGVKISILLSSLETRLQFTYLNHLNFLHEKDLRNYHIWYAELIF